MLINGRWQETWSPYQGSSATGEFIRQTSSFRNWITPDGRAGKTGVEGFKAELGRYHLYVALICPWACRVLTTIALKGLEDVFTIDIVSPKLGGEQGWEFSPFPGATGDRVNDTSYLHQLYSLADNQYSGKATVPLLWDKTLNVAVNNESADIIEMLNSAFDQWAKNDIDLRPNYQLPEILEINERIYRNFNNGVYRAGFAQSQQAYESAYHDVFETLDWAEKRLADSAYLVGDSLTEADVRLFVTLVRFDLAYYGLFKTNKKRIADYPNVNAYMQRIYAKPGIANTVSIEHIKAGYYSIKQLNPKGIVPSGPDDVFDAQPIQHAAGF